ncbi:hypothetical protein AB0D78_28115 [Streptomyces avermitilis]|uniref:hypothetical protein n=1 Tax=Streptomyces avermitilis TaxID=33903 RepID=UPI003402CFE6
MAAEATHLDLAAGIAAAARQAGQDDPIVRGADVRTGTVTAVGATAGTVDVGVIRARRLESYQNPVVGDQILLVQSGNGNWWAAGRPASASAPIGLPRYAYKANHTDRASTTTLADDPELTMQLDANAVYAVEFHLHYAATDVARIKTAWTVPASASGNRSAVGPDQGVILSSTSSGGAGRWGVHNFPTLCIYGTRDSATSQCAALEEATVITATGGTCALQWAQNTSSATATRMAQGSWMRATRIA